MTKTLFHNANQIITNSSERNYELDILKNASLLVEDGKVVWVGASDDAPDSTDTFDCTGKVILPGFVDSHTHLIFAGERSDEFAARMAGETYTAGGINYTVSKTRTASDNELRENAKKLINEMYANGTTHFEIKSGYGLTLEDEIRSLRIAREFTEDVTLMAAHVVPTEFAENRHTYVKLVIEEILPAAKGLAKFVDVFCEQGAFTETESKAILQAAASAGFKLKIHANQLQHSNAILLAKELGTISVDHCTFLDEKDIHALKSTVATLLPATEFSTNGPYPDAKLLINSDVKVAIATNCNPGSSFTTSMPFCIAIAVREMNFSIEEAIWSATKGGALALGDFERGVLKVGSRADFSILNAPSYVHLAYRPGVSLIEATFVSGKAMYKKGRK